MRPHLGGPRVRGVGLRGVMSTALVAMLAAALCMPRVSCDFYTTDARLAHLRRDNEDVPAAHAADAAAIINTGATAAVVNRYVAAAALTALHVLLIGCLFHPIVSGSFLGDPADSVLRGEAAYSVAMSTRRLASDTAAVVVLGMVTLAVQSGSRTLRVLYAAALVAYASMSVLALGRCLEGGECACGVSMSESGATHADRVACLASVAVAMPVAVLMWVSTLFVTD